jgi:hypothetical protein
MEPAARKMSSPTLNFNPDDPRFEALFGYAGRIEKLLKAPTVPANPDLAGSLDDFLGAVYALIQAKHHDFKSRPDRPIKISPVAKMAAEIAKGTVRTNGPWIAGFYFNNALFRTAAVYHRILQIVVGKDGNVPTLQSEAIGHHGQWMSIKLHKVYSQVNELKHERQGVYAGRLVTYQEALNAIGDLLDLIEAWMAASAQGVNNANGGIGSRGSV